MPYKRFEQEDLILRDELAIDRTRLANERTFLSYLRTALTLAIVAGTIIHLFKGWLIFLLSLVFFAAAAVFFCHRLLENTGHAQANKNSPKTVKSKPSGTGRVRIGKNRRVRTGSIEKDQNGGVTSALRKRQRDALFK